MKGGLEKKMLGEHLSVSCVPIIQRAVVPVPILQPGWKPLQSFPSRLFFCPGLNMIRFIGFFLTLSLKFVAVLLSIPFPRYVKLLSIQCFPIDIEYKVKTFLIEKEFLCKNGILKKILKWDWNLLLIYVLIFGPRGFSMLQNKTNNITIIQLWGLTVLSKTQLHNTEIDKTYIYYIVYSTYFIPAPKIFFAILGTGGWAHSIVDGHIG